MRKCKSKKETLKLHTISCACLHNLCIELNVSALTNWDVSKGNRITQKEIQEILTMINCTQTRDISKEAKCIHEILEISFGLKKVQEISNE